MSVLACGGQATESTTPLPAFRSRCSSGSDVAVHRIQVSVSNTTDTLLHITDLRLDSCSFEPSAPVKVDTTLDGRRGPTSRSRTAPVCCNATAIPARWSSRWTIIATVAMAVGDARAKDVRFLHPGHRRPAGLAREVRSAGSTSSSRRPRSPSAQSSARKGDPSASCRHRHPPGDDRRHRRHDPLRAGTGEEETRRGPGPRDVRRSPSRSGPPAAIPARLRRGQAGPTCSRSGGTPRAGRPIG